MPAGGKGRVHEPNDEEYFTLGKQSVKLRTSDRLLKITYDAEKPNLSASSISSANAPTPACASPAPSSNSNGC